MSDPKLIKLQEENAQLREDLKEQKGRLKAMETCCAVMSQLLNERWRRYLPEHLHEKVKALLKGSE